jgi:uncharacterized protein YndB with AHSA1/START domain
VQANDVIPSDKPEFTLQRVFHAPRELVYMIWTQPEYVKQWWGVDDCAIVVCELDVRPGGSFRIDMKTADGNVYVNRGVYIDVVPNERLVTKDERDEGVLPGNIPAGIHTVTFEDVDGDTVVTLTSRFAHIQDRDLLVSFGIVDGIRQSLNRFQQLVALVTLQRERKTS